MINAIFAAWLVVSAWRGFRQGWIFVLLVLVSLGLAYAICILALRPLTNTFGEQ